LQNGVRIKRLTPAAGLRQQAAGARPFLLRYPAIQTGWDFKPGISENSPEEEENQGIFLCKA